MKNLLFAASLLIWIASGCGMSEEEKQAKQQENEAKVNEKVDKIMQDLEATSMEAERAAEDTSAVDTSSSE